MKDRAYTEKNKDTETKIEIPTPTPAASVCQISHNSTEAQTETEKTGITNIILVKSHCADRPAASRTARFTSKMQTDCRYIICELEPLYE